MRRWNGWGKENTDLTMQLSAGLRQLLGTLLGPGTALPEASLTQVVDSVPTSRLKHHKLISQDPETRVRHARGQSLPDWLAMRSGDIVTFPDGVAFPTSIEQVRELLSYADSFNIVVIPYGGGTSVVGHINPIVGNLPVLTISLAKMNQLIDLDTTSHLATFGAGAAGPDIEAQLNKQGYTLGHFPQSWEFSTIGGWVASRSSGQQSLHYGRIEQLFAAADVETPNGSLHIPSIPASSAGPDIREMILGSEGRLGVITQVTARVTPLPEEEAFQVVFFPSWEAGLAASRALVQQRVALSMVRLSNALETTSLLYMGAGDNLQAITDLEQSLAKENIASGKVMMTIGVTGSAQQCHFNKQTALDICATYGGLADSSGLADNWAHGRFRAPYLRDPLGSAGYAVDTMETALNWSDIEHAMDQIEGAIRNALSDEGEQVFVYSHLSHIYGQGSSIYTTYLFRFADSYQETLKRWKKLKAAGAKQILALGGTISHQHGVGLDHRDYLEAEKSSLGLGAINSLCDYFDPKGLMNPGKLLPPNKEKSAARDE